MPSRQRRGGLPAHGTRRSNDVGFLRIRHPHVDERLNAMGRERWECYHVSEHEQGRVFYFKRRTSNAVAYLTNLLRVGAVAF